MIRDKTVFHNMYDKSQFSRYNLFFDSHFIVAMIVTNKMSGSYDFVFIHVRLGLNACA